MKRDQILTFSLFLFLGAMTSCLVGLIVIFVAPIVAVIIWFAASENLTSEKRRLRTVGYLAGAIGHFAVIVSFVNLMSDHPKLYSLAYRTNAYTTMMHLGLGYYGGFERLHNVYLYRTEQSSTGFDVYSGRDFLEATSGKLYSIGPDLIDQNLTVIFDPTNGVVSGGDIPIKPLESE